MKRWVFATLLIVVLLVGSTWAYQTQKIKALQCDDCNVVLIISDTLAAKHLGIYGDERNTSPFIDDFFGDGLVFKNAYATAPWTLPSIPSMFLPELGSDITYEELRPDNPDALTSQLRKHDIAVRGLFYVEPEKDGEGSDSNGIKYSPQVDVIAQSVKAFFTPEEQKGTNFGGNTFEDAGRVVKKLSERYQKDNKRFFFTLHDFTVHAPYTPPPKYRSLFEEHDGPSRIGWNMTRDLWRSPAATTTHLYELRYDQEVRWLDDGIQDFISAMPDDVQKKTIFIFVGDHGEAFGEHERLSHGHTLYNEEIRVPFLIARPGTPIDRTVKQNVSLVELAPTIADMMNIQMPHSWNKEGLLADAYAPPPVESVNGRPVFFSELADTDSFETVQEKYATTSLIATAEEARITHNIKQIRTYGSMDAYHPDDITDGKEVYNLLRDPHETVDLSNQPYSGMNINEALKTFYSYFE